MTPIRILLALGLAFGLSACVAGDQVSRGIASPNTDLSVAAKNGAGAVVMAPRYQVTDIRIDVPADLKVSEANLFLPIADIVWRGEPRGDRYAQVRAIFQEAFAAGTGRMTEGPAVIVEAKVTRFHCLTEKTRYTVGGTHALRYQLTVRDAVSGAIIDGPRAVVADVKASGGDAAIAEDMAGRTQRVVVVEALMNSIRRELSAPVRMPEGMPTSRNTVPEALTTVTQVW